MNAGKVVQALWRQRYAAGSVVTASIVLGVVAAATWQIVPAVLGLGPPSPRDDGGFQDLSRSFKGKTINWTDAQRKGQASARVAVVEFSDYQCPYCGSFAREAFPAISEKYVASGKVLWVFKHLPLRTIHPAALKAAEAAECAGAGGRFWQMSELLFADQSALDEAALRRRAKQLGLDMREFNACLDGRATAKIEQDVAEATMLGIQGTPSFLFVKTAGDSGEIVKALAGAGSAAEFARVLDEMLTSIGGNDMPK